MSHNHHPGLVAGTRLYPFVSHECHRTPGVTALVLALLSAVKVLQLLWPAPGCRLHSTGRRPLAMDLDHAHQNPLWCQHILQLLMALGRHHRFYSVEAGAVLHVMGFVPQSMGVVLPRAMGVLLRPTVTVLVLVLSEVAGVTANMETWSPADLCRYAPRGLHD